MQDDVIGDSDCEDEESKYWSNELDLLGTVMWRLYGRGCAP